MFAKSLREAFFSCVSNRSVIFSTLKKVMWTFRFSAIWCVQLWCFLPVAPFGECFCLHWFVSWRVATELSCLCDQRHKFQQMIKWIWLFLPTERVLLWWSFDTQMRWWFGLDTLQWHFAACQHIDNVDVSNFKRCATVVRLAVWQPIIHLTTSPTPTPHTHPFSHHALSNRWQMTTTMNAQNKNNWQHHSTNKDLQLSPSPKSIGIRNPWNQECCFGAMWGFRMEEQENKSQRDFIFCASVTGAHANDKNEGRQRRHIWRCHHSSSIFKNLFLNPIFHHVKLFGIFNDKTVTMSSQTS